jgi:acetyl esterase/lipase
MLRLVVAFFWAGAPALSQEKPPAEQVYKKTDQGELKIHLSFPSPWKADDKRPAIVFFFGGGWTQGTVAQFAKQADYLAARGMVAARADYRVKSRHQVTPDKCVEDAKSAVRWLRAKAPALGVDPDRIVAAGGSAGGHIAACTALVEGLDAAGEEAGVSSRPNALVLFNPAMGPEPLLQRMPGQEDLARRIAPTLLVRKEIPPALLLFGSQDPLLEPAREFIRKSKECGNVAELYLAEGPGHGFFNRSPWLERTLYRTDEFLATLGYVQGKPTLELPKDPK